LKKVTRTNALLKKKQTHTIGRLVKEDAERQAHSSSAAERLNGYFVLKKLGY